jgi:ATP-dependent Lhr-like helicase
LGELVARGLVTADGFAGLRNLIRESAEQRSGLAGRALRQTPRLIRHRRSPNQIGRWSVWRETSAPVETQDEPQRRREVVEQWAWQLLRRWGVIFKDLLQKEPGAPPWWELVQVYRKLEARGEIRGGRFVRGVAGEQFAVGETVVALRRLRDERTGPQVAVREVPDARAETNVNAADLEGAAPQSFVVISASDPLNLTGILDGGPRVPAQAGNRVILHHGRFVAAWDGREWTFAGECPAGIRQRLQQAAPLPSEAVLSSAGPS